MGNLWYRERRRVSGYKCVDLYLIERHDGVNGPVIISRDGELWFMMPGELKSFAYLTSSEKFTLCLPPKQENDILTQLRADSERITLTAKDGTQYGVPKALLIPSQYFRAIFAGQFKESINNEVKIDDMPSSTVAAFVEYLERDTINCGFGDLVRLGHMANRWIMPGLLKKVELEICARFDQLESEEDWKDALALGAVLASRWIALSYGHRVTPDASKAK